MKPPQVTGGTRRSFGGKYGIWWRTKTIRRRPTITLGSKSKEDPKAKESTPTASTPPFSNHGSTIGWDPVLCRPIYNHAPSTGFFCFSNSVDEDDGDNDTSNKEENNIATLSPPSSPEPLQKTPVKRTRQFYGLRKRLPFFIEPDEEYQQRLPALKKKRLEDNSSETIKEVTTESGVKPLKDTSDPAPEVGSTQQGVRGRRARTQVGASRRRTVASSSNDSLKENAQGSDTTFDFDDNDAERIPSVPEKSTNKTKAVQQPNAKSSLDEARAFFERLDATEVLTLDASATPTAPGKVYRTKARLCTTSPRFTREYSDYFQAIQATGVSPLGIQEYARHRMNFCRLGELYNGLLEGGDDQLFKEDE
jgi:hypothetical protein